jgi:hypothetical protein
VLAQHGVERVGGDEILGKVRRHLHDPRGDSRDDRGMREVGRDQSLEVRDEFVNALGREVGAEELDGDELVLPGVVRSKYRAECARANLMKNAERTERVWGRGTACFRVQ